MVKMEREISHCGGCNCMTHSIRKGMAKFMCGKCGYDKSLGDVFQYELSSNSNITNKESEK